MVRSSIISSAIWLILLWLATVVTASAQRDPRLDSARIHQAVVDEHPDLSFTASARKLLARQLRRGDYEDARDLIVFMRRSAIPNATGWLTGGEELIARTIIAPGPLLRDPAELTEFLRRRVVEPRNNPGYTDGLYRVLGSYLSEDFASIARRFADDDPTGEEVDFFNLLENHLVVHGLRAREELNRRADDFATRYPNSALARLAREYIIVPYRESDFGFAFHAGYTGGAYAARTSGLVGKMGGPSIGLEIYYLQGILVGNVAFGTLEIKNQFTHGTDQWRTGDAPIINATFDLGWEFRFARLALVPIAGVSLMALDAPSKSYQANEVVPATGGLLGYDISGMVTYRIFPSDVGPHLDLRIRGGWTGSGLGDYDPAIGGSLWYGTIGIALVQRPYRGGE